MQDQELVPRVALLHLARSWWVLVVALLLGAVVGWGISFFLRPVYETRFAFTIGVDFALSGPLEEITLDQIKYAAGGTMYSPALRERVSLRLQAEGIDLSPADLKEMAFRETHLMIWQIRLRHTDPDLLYHVARVWGEEAYAYLQEAYSHAVRVMGLQQRLKTLAGCSPEILVEGEPVIEGCVLPEGMVAEAELARLNAELQQEMPLTLGIYPGIIFDYTNPPEYPTAPVQFQRASLVFAGAVIGLVIGLWGVILRPQAPGKRA